MRDTTEHRKHSTNTTASSGVVLTDRPDMRLIKLSFLAATILLGAGILVYGAPLPVDRDVKVVGSLFVVGLGLASVAVVLGIYEAFATAVYTVTTDFIESELGILSKSIRRIPISYVRDVTYDQGVIQGMLGISSITVSATNGEKIFLRNIADGRQKRDIIWNLVLSRSPRQHG